MPLPVLNELSRIPIEIDIPEDVIFYAIALLTSAVHSLSDCFVVFAGYLYIFAGLSQKIGYLQTVCIRN